MADKRVLLVGYGSVGAAVDARLAGFEVDVTRVARSPRPGRRPWSTGSTSCPTCCRDADVVVLTVPLTDETRGLVDAAFLARASATARSLVNAARGPVVVTDALVAECASGRLLAALDVTDPEPLPADHPLVATAERAHQPARRRQHLRVLPTSYVGCSPSSSDVRFRAS